jgi:acyl-CoA thioesterase-1
MHVPVNYGRRYSDKFNQTYHAVAKNEDIKIAPFFLENVATRAELIQTDGLHPTAEAQAIILQNILPHITPLLD